MTVAPTGTIDDMAVVTDPEETLHPLSVDDYLRMVDVGILDEDDKVELLEGAIFAMSPEGRPHRAILARLMEYIVRGLADPLLMVTGGSPLELRPDSMPQPDFSVVNRAEVTPHNASEGAHLVVEVSYSSLRKDLNRKARIYARAGIREYWVVDLQARVVHVHLEPRANGYAVRHAVAPPAMLQPAYVQLPPLALDELLAWG